ncbi:hypothetical protein [Leptolyngbya sp. ST-U4]|uniref:phosphoribosyltransferase-like protein n=1 Tax=Leptolyngbya sp. ST-U4 TaxID=2933912 RepID=UPI003299CF01
MSQESSNNNSKSSRSQRSRKTLSSITARCRKPLSAILPRRKDIVLKEIYTSSDIDSLCIKLKDLAGNFSSTSVKEWVAQFEPFIDRNIAFLLLDLVQGFSELEIRTFATRKLQDLLYDYLMNQEHIYAAFISSGEAPNEVNFRRWLRNKVITYAQLPQPQDSSVESQFLLWSLYETSVLQGRDASCNSVRKLRELDEFFSSSKQDPKTSALVFMDYTNATGNQLSKCLKVIDRKLDKYPKWREATYVFMYIVEMDNIDVLKSFQVKSSTTLFFSRMLHYQESQILAKLAEYGVSEEEYNEFVLKYCRRSGEEATGYKNSGALTCHHYSCPNNTLPFFWKNNDNWKGIFYGSQTSRAANYRKS